MRVHDQISLLTMPSIAQSSRPLSSQCHTLPLQSTSKQGQIDVDTYRTQQQALQEWLFTPIPGERSDDLLRTLHKYTLAYGLGVLQKRMEALVDLDLKLYRKYACLLSDDDPSQRVTHNFRIPHAPIQSGPLEKRSIVNTRAPI